MTKFLNSGYSHHGASTTKPAFLKWASFSKSAHEDISDNLELLRNRSRDLYMGGGPLGRGAIDRLILNAVGSGLKLNSRLDDNALKMPYENCRALANKIESEFDYFASSKACDFSHANNFYELQVLALKSVLIDGECFAILTDERTSRFPYRLRIMLIESERVKTPPNRPAHVMIDNGVELDDLGRPVAIWITNRNPNSEITYQPAISYKRVPIRGILSGRRNVIHLMNSERISQHRGVPFLAPVIEQLKQLSRYTDAELMAAVVSGMYAIFFEHTPRDEGALGEEEYASEQGLGEVSGLEGISQEQMYGAVMDLPEGVKPVGLSPSRPNNNFSAFVEGLVHQIGGALGIPSELIFLQFTASYSASRGALLEAWKLFRYWRQWFSENFCQVVFEEWLYEAVSIGRINAPGFFEDDYRAKLFSWSEWTGPSQGQLNPVQEVQASILKVENGFSTYQREASELTGTDYELNALRLAREKDLQKGE